MADDFKYQISDKVGDLIFLVRGNDAAEVVSDYTGLVEQLKGAGVEKQVRPAAPAPTLAQATQTVGTILGGTPVTGQSGPPHPPMPSTGGDGDIHPTKSCPICQASLKISDKLTKAGDRWYRKLECSSDYKHTKDKAFDDLVWSEDYKKKRY